MQTVDTDYLRLALTKSARFQQFDKRANQWTNIDAPGAVARSVCVASPWSGMAPLSGIVEAPILRHDGTLLDRPGYDEATGLLFDPGQTRFGPISPKPTREQAKDALRLLLTIIKEFPFVDDASRSVAISAFITPSCGALCGRRRCSFSTRQ